MPSACCGASCADVRSAQRFRRQVPPGPYIADFVSFEHRLVIEVDGGQHAEQKVHDERRSALFRSQDYHVLRFWNNDVIANVDGVLQEITRVLSLPPTPTLTLPHKGGGSSTER